jgi:hypothetical protein
MIDYEGLKNILKAHPAACAILDYANGKRDYKEISKLTKIHKTKVSTILRKAFNLNLLEKKEGLYKKTKEFKPINVKKLVKDSGINNTQQSEIKTKRKSKRNLTTVGIKKEIKEYLVNHYYIIEHPFAPDKKLKISKADIEIAAAKLFEYLDADFELEQLKTLSLRFYESFAHYWGCNRYKKDEQINAFSSLVKNFEPFVKKVAAIKSRNVSLGKKSLNNETISNAMTFTSDIDKHQEDYWKDKDIKEACIRIVYPYRHKEAHEARDYFPYQMEKIVFYMFAAIIFICLDKPNP